MYIAITWKRDFLKNNFKRIVRYILGVCCLSLVLGGGIFLLTKPKNSAIQRQSETHKVTSTKKKVHSQKINLVGLGDSLTFGQEDPTNRGGYVYLIKQKLQKNYDVKVSTSNYGKTGDRTDQIQKRLEDDPAMQKKISEADVITMTFGGNDLMQILQNNFPKLFANQLSSIMPQKENQYRQKVESLLSTVRHYNPAAPIFVISVYNPFYVYFPTVPALQKYTDQWVNVTEQAIKSQQRVYFVNVNQRLSQGQYLGKNQTALKKQSKLNLENLSSQEVEQTLNDHHEKNDYLSSNDHFHPNLKGYQYMTNQLYKVMMTHHSTWLNSDTTKRSDNEKN